MNDKLKEKVLVVKNSVIFRDGEWQGLKTEKLDYYYDIIQKNHEFIERGAAEDSQEYQQIIPYVLFKFKDKFFLYEYLKGTTETRLHHNYILGIAGHINPIDKSNKDVIEESMMREWNEEVDFDGNIIGKKFVGILNDSRRDVEKVHLGLIYVFEGDGSEIFIKETNKMKGELMDIEGMRPLIGNTEYLGWAPILYPYLKNF